MSRKNTHNVLYLSERNGRLVIDGTAAVKVEGYEDADSRVIPTMHVVDRKRAQSKARRALQRKVFSLVTMAVIMIAGCLSIIWYIGIQSQLTQAAREVGTLSSNYQALVTSNDARMAEITEGIDLGSILVHAIDDLDMAYADEGQIINYAADGYDSVTQVQIVSGH